MIKGWIMPRDISEFTDQVRAVTIVPELLTPADGPTAEHRAADLMAP